jgi:two-component system cell cycle sensor histidine kinase/response regulator CckA
VDDESSIRHLLETVLTGQGWQVKLADGAESALALVNAAPTPPTLMICDVVMPKTNGLSLTRQMLARLPKLQVIFISGKIADAAWWPADLSNIRLLGKPLANEDLILAVNEALTEAKALD